ncbi:iron-containing alcohol dehydrogenase [Cryobacterium sp. Y11]|uniref:iron-containing alcohol dehydrogenase n=1 Tax=Cryobacterium sp. Y11 TaxID=2045016 RepID=UPI0018ED6B4D|nr:iron-containing alcohol dehydrogenase [Cryobacterium sp. Y11]
MSTTIELQERALPPHNKIEGGFGLLRQPGIVIFGAGQRASIAGVVESLGQSALLCTDQRMAVSAEFADIVSALKARGVSVSIYADIEAELPRTNVEDLVQRIAGESIDVVVGIGGGSCLDMAKIATVMLTYGGDVASYYGEFKVPGPTLPLVTVPTTAGTGAEITCIAVIYDPDLEMKIGVASPHLGASVTVIDPEFTLTCPPGLTAATGADALSHLIEAFTAKAKNPEPGTVETFVYVGKNSLTDMHCRAGLELMGTALERVVASPSDIDARSDAMLAAMHAGFAINTTGTAAVHALQAPIGALTHTPHGIGVGTLLPYVMRYNLPTRVPEFASMAELLDVADPGHSELENARAAITRVDEILTALRIPADLEALGVDSGDIPSIASHAIKATRLTANNPRELTEESMIRILNKAFTGDRSWWS